MIKNLQIISQHSQVKELGNALKFDMLKQLIRGSATCQQLATAFGISKQKIHYNLNKLIEEKLIEVVDEEPGNGKEVYYRATAKNYVLDFSLGEHLNGGLINGRGVINSILEGEYKLQLCSIAAKLLKDSLKLKARQKLLIVTGKYNLPLVEKILLEAGRMNIRCTTIYQDTQMLKAKYDEYSLVAFQSDYEHFNRLLKTHDAYLNLNGEARHIELRDPEKVQLRAMAYAGSHEILREHKIRVAMMPGLLNDTLSEKSIESELQFWKALDVDYEQLRDETLSICESYVGAQTLSLESHAVSLNFRNERIVAECGSFGQSSCQSPVINYPGGEVLILPQAGSANGRIEGDVAYAFGEKIIQPVLEIKNGEIMSFSATQNQELLAKAITAGGADGRKIALVGVGTNPNVSLANIDLSFSQKSRGLVTVWWGDNRSIGGQVMGGCEWFVQIEKPKLKSL